MGITTKTRVLGTTATLKAKKAEDHILLARGLSARYCGANTPLVGLTGEEMERDLRHMEAYANACTAYAQQYYIYQNKTENQTTTNHSTSNSTTSTTNHAEGNDKIKAPGAGGGASGGALSSSMSMTQQQQQQQQPLIAMPVRIDPEEEKRLMTLRQKIQQCEGQREVLESQYLSLRAHYVYLSQKLKTFRKTGNGHAEFLQALVQKRAKLVALQRARLQMAREVLTCLHYRQTAKVEDDNEDEDDDDDDEDHANRKEDDLVEVWNQVDEQFKKAEQACRSDGGTVEWHAIKIPTIPPGVPLYVSQLAKAPGFAAAWGTGSMFGSKPDTLCWIESSLRRRPHDPPHGERIKELPALREEVDFLQRELGRERTLNKDLQSNIIARRKRNDGLGAMMALLRTETEAVVARHNVLLESDQAKDAAYKLHQEEEFNRGDSNMNFDHNNNESSETNNNGDSNNNENNNSSNNININNHATGIVEETTPKTIEETDPQEVAVVKEEGEMEEGEEGEIKTSEQPSLTLTVQPTNDIDIAPAEAAAAVDSRVSKVEDNENDGDDEGTVGEEDDDEEGEILEGGEEEGDGSSKRDLEVGENGSPRTNKRRKL